MTGLVEERPCLTALAAERALPAADFGPPIPAREGVERGLAMGNDVAIGVPFVLGFGVRGSGFRGASKSRSRSKIEDDWALDGSGAGASTY
jgi:hypothetical protein